MSSAAGARAPAGGGLALVASRVRLEERWLLDRLAQRGIAHELIDSRDWLVRLRPDHRDDRELAGEPPRVALIREISFHRARYAARLVEWLGGVAVNPAEVIEVCGDKVRTTMALLAAGLPVPETAVALTLPAAQRACDLLGYPAVVKPVVGSWGRMVARLAGPEVAATVLEHREHLPNPLHQIGYVQRYVDKPDRDIRVLVVGDEPVAAMYRYAETARTNLATGAQPRPCPIEGPVADLAAAAAAAVGGGVLGVDLVEDRAGGLYLLEVNHAVEFRGLQSVCQLDLADLLISHSLAAGRELSAGEPETGRDRSPMVTR